MSGAEDGMEMEWERGKSFCLLDWKFGEGELGTESELWKRREREENFNDSHLLEMPA